MSLWDYKDPRRQEVIKKRFQTADEFAIWAGKEQAGLSEAAANGMHVLITVTCTLLDRQITALADAFQKDGGFSERLYQMRSESRRRG